MFPNNNNNNNNRPPGKQPPQMPTPPQDWRRWIWPGLMLLLLVWLFLRIPDTFGGGSGTEANISYDALFIQAEADNIDRIEVVEPVVRGAFRAPTRVTDVNTGQTIEARSFSSNLLPEGNEPLFNILLANNAQIVPEQADPNILLFVIANVLPLLLLVGLLFWFTRRAQRQMGGALNFGRTQAREYTVERPKVTFDDVAGQNAAKQELREIVDFLKEPDKYIALGARIPRGVLLVGPPGTGKTLLARAVAGEANVSFFSIAASEFVEMFVGVGASRVRDLFKRAKDNAPSIVFIDEIDAVGRQRGAGLGGGNDEREQTLNQMLAEMDGFDQSESVIVMAATNRPDVLDPALLRPGRFDRQVTVALPDRQGRHDILKIHTRGKPLDATVNLEDLAKTTIGFSGADLSNLANEAALTAARRNARRITNRDFSDAFDRIVLGAESPPLSDENERKLVAYHEAGHALTAALTPFADPVYKITIVPRGQALGVVTQLPDMDRRNYSESWLRSRMMVALGGRAAEEAVFGEVTTGAESDLRQVTSIARRMVAQFGMSDQIGPINFGDDERQPFLGYSLSQGRNYSEATAARIDAEVRRMIDEAYSKTIELIQQNRDKLDRLASELLVREIINKDEMFAIINVQPKDEQTGLESVQDELEKLHAPNETENSPVTNPLDNNSRLE
jgi:cell division protease FtsH